MDGDTPRFENIPQRPSIRGRFREKEDVQFSFNRLDSGLSDFTHEVGEVFGDVSLHQSVLWVPDRNKVTPIHVPSHIDGGLAGAVLHADLRTDIDDDRDFQTLNAIKGTIIPLRGTTLGYQLKQARSQRQIPQGAVSSVNPEQYMVSMPVRIDKTVAGMVQFALRNTPGDISNFQAGKISQLWRGSYEPIFQTELAKIHSTHRDLNSPNLLIDDLELNSTTIAANSISLTLDLEHSTQRALEHDNGAFNSFLLRWKHEVARLITYHDLDNKSEVLGNVGDGLSVAFWMPSEVDFYNDDEIETFQDMVALPFTQGLLAMSKELGAQYPELGPLHFKSALGKSFIRVNGPNDLWSTDLWHLSQEMEQK